MAVCASIRGTRRHPLRKQPATKRKSASAAARDSAVATSKAAAIINVNTESETDSAAAAAAAAMEQAGTSDAELAPLSEIGDTTLDDDELSGGSDGTDAGDSQPDATRENVGGAGDVHVAPIVQSFIAASERLGSNSIAGPAQETASQELTESALRQLPDRCPSKSSHWEAAASFAPGSEAGLTSGLDELPPGSEAGFSCTTAASFDPKYATRSQAFTKASGDVEEINPLCTKCGYPTEVLNAVLKTKASAAQHAKYVCRPCNAVTTMVFRNLRQEGPLRMTDWDDAQVQEFYRRAQESLNGGRMKWSMVRDCIKKSMVKRVTEATEKRMHAEYKPLGVWEKLGYEVEMIAAYNKTEWNPAVGMCYAVPLKSISWKHTEEEVEEQILQYEVKNKRKTCPDDEDDDGDDAETPHMTKGEAKRRKVEAETRKAEVEAAKEARKESAQVKAHNSKMQILASKTVTALSSSCDALKKVTLNKHWRDAPTFMAEKVAADLQTAVSYLKEADDVLKNLKKCSKDQTRLPTLGFDMKDMVDLAKSMKKDKSDWDAFEKLCRKV